MECLVIFIGKNVSSNYLLKGSSCALALKMVHHGFESDAGWSVFVRCPAELGPNFSGYQT